jgi:TRAP-type C4-dicarboxylate transport system permease small subunit
MPLLLRIYKGILLFLNSVGTVWIFLLMLVIVTDVIGRTAFTRPLPGVPELVSLSIVAIVFLQLPQALRAGRITRVEALSDWLATRSPRFAAALQGVYSLLGAALFVALFAALQPLFERAWVNNDYVGVEGYITYPVWPVRLFMLIGCVGGAIQYLLFALNDFRKSTGRAPVESEAKAGEIA